MNKLHAVCFLGTLYEYRTETSFQHEVLIHMTTVYTLVWRITLLPVTYDKNENCWLESNIYVYNMVESCLLLSNFMFGILVMGKINDFYYLIKAKNMALRLDHNIPIKKGIFHLHAIVRIKPCIRGVIHIMNSLSPDLGGQYDLLA